jgi:hypothetical protein
MMPANSGFSFLGARVLQLVEPQNHFAGVQAVGAAYVSLGASLPGN